MSETKGKNAPMSVKRADSNALRPTTGRRGSQQPSGKADNRLEGQRSRKERAKDVAANIGVLYGVATTLPAVAAGVVCAICAFPIGGPYALGHRLCTHEPIGVGQRWEEAVTRGYSLGTKTLGGSFIVERSLKHLGGSDYGDGRDANGEKRKLVIAPWRRPDNSIKRTKAKREEYRETLHASQA